MAPRELYYKRYRRRGRRIFSYRTQKKHMPASGKLHRSTGAAWEFSATEPDVFFARFGLFLPEYGKSGQSSDSARASGGPAQAPQK
jgi:hypothetical protein